MIFVVWLYIWSRFKLQQSPCVVSLLPSEMTQVMCVLHLLLSQNKIACMVNMAFVKLFKNVKGTEGLSTCSVRVFMFSPGSASSWGGKRRHGYPSAVAGSAGSSWRANIKNYKVTVTGSYHRTDHYHESLRPWSKLGKYSLNKSINLLVSILSDVWVKQTR
jgi:hypothetical protein